MSSPRRRRRPNCDGLEDRCCPAFVGPLPQFPVSMIPVQRSDPASVALQDLYKQELANWSPQVVFYGDSITYNFAYLFGSQAWASAIAPLDAADLGEQGDMTQNILWRIENGEFPPDPKVVVLQAGANNLGTDNESPAVTVAGIENLVNVIHALSPTSKIVVEGMIPVGGPTDAYRPEIVRINAQLAKFVDNMSSFFVDVGPSLVAADGTLQAVDEPDLVHPNELGYQIWAADIIGLLDHLLDITPAPSSAPFVGPLVKRP